MAQRCWVTERIATPLSQLPGVGFKACSGGPAPHSAPSGQRRHSHKGARHHRRPLAPWASGRPHWRIFPGFLRARRPPQGWMNMVSYQQLCPLPLPQPCVPAPHPGSGQPGPHTPQGWGLAQPSSARSRSEAAQLLLPGARPPQHPDREQLHPAEPFPCLSEVALAVPTSSCPRISLWTKSRQVRQHLTGVPCQDNVPFWKVLSTPRRGWARAWCPCPQQGTASPSAQLPTVPFASKAMATKPQPGMQPLPRRTRLPWQRAAMHGPSFWARQNPPPAIHGDIIPGQVGTSPSCMQ